VNAVILIGGFGTRLRPLTLSQPKALLPILNRPFLSYQIDVLKRGGVKTVMFAAGAHIRPWEKAIRRLQLKGQKFHFAFEPKPLGTGGAIRFALDALKKKGLLTTHPLLVFNGDVFFDLDIKSFARFHSTNRSACTIALTRVKDASKFGVVARRPSGQIKRFIEKPKHMRGGQLINAGAYLFEPKLIDDIPTGAAVSLEKEFFPRSLQKGRRFFGYPMKGYWNDIGTHETYLQAHKDLLDQNNRWTGIKYLRKRVLHLGRGVAVVGDKSILGKNIKISGFFCCGKNVTMGENCTIHNSVVLDHATIGNGVSLSSAIIGRDCFIDDHVKFKTAVILGKRTRIFPYTRG
jgi:NDP-sugar pyrophosphorylase family protein